MLKTTSSLVVEHREINLKSIKKSPPCSLDFIVPEGTLQDTRGENNGLNQCWSLKSGLSLWQTRKTHLLMQYWYKCYGVTNHICTEFEACSRGLLSVNVILAQNYSLGDPRPEYRSCYWYFSKWSCCQIIFQIFKLIPNDLCFLPG